MRNIKFDRRSLLRGLGYGTVLCSGLSKNLYAQTPAPCGWRCSPTPTARTPIRTT